MWGWGWDKKVSHFTVVPSASSHLSVSGTGPPEQPLGPGSECGGRKPRHLGAPPTAPPTFTRKETEIPKGDACPLRSPNYQVEDSGEDPTFTAYVPPLTVTKMSRGMPAGRVAGDRAGLAGRGDKGAGSPCEKR